MPADLVTNPTTGLVIREYLQNLFENWKAKGADMVQDSWGEENFQRHALPRPIRRGACRSIRLIVVESSGFDPEHALGILMRDLCADAFIERN
jgi:hypothetical protein